MPTKPKKVLIIAQSGIGNLLMQLPTITAIKEQHPDWHITAWIAPRNTKAIAQNASCIDEIIEKPIKLSILEHLKHTFYLFKQKYDIGIVLFPGQLWKSAAYLFLSGAKKRIGHKYPSKINPNNSLLTDIITPQQGLHDIEQNLNLLVPLNISIIKKYNKPYTISINDNYASKEILDNLPHNKMFFGIHPGSAPDFVWKRWPLESFAQVANYFIKKYNMHLLIFGGQNENKLKKELSNNTNNSSSIISTDLLTTAAVIKKCSFFLSNDSGLMHLSAAAGTPTFGIFGPTDERKTGPRGRKSYIIRDKQTKPVYNTNNNYDLGNTTHASLLSITPQDVITQIESKNLLINI